MRIRKHAKISPLVYAASYLKPGTVIQTHVVCQLNQSPWDVTTFPSPSNPETPPPPPLVCQAEDSYMVDGNFADFIAADQSAPSMNFEVGDDEMQKWDHGGSNIPPAEMFDNNGGTEMEQEFNNDDDGGEIINLCCKSDGKGWQCRRKTKEGHSLCEHHSYSHTHQANKTSNSAHSVGKKSEKPPESRRRPRARKPTATTSSSNPYEYYYYSGFGPRWGKKRGPAATKKAEPYTSSGGSEASKNDVELVAEPNTPNNNNNNNASAAAETEAEEEESFAFPRSSRMDIEGFDYIEDDDDDDDEDEDDEIGQTEKKRARKPIKARSLKSLM